MPDRPDAGAEPAVIDRFAFGANWASFSRHIDEPRRVAARDSLRSHLGDLSHLSFLDVGCGSGLFSLAAVELGAARVLSFDFDADSVATARALRRRFVGGADSSSWTIEQGDILDPDYVDRLGQWDVVYSWGVLHHTGDMTRAWENVARAVTPGGRLFLSIYNDQGRKSRIWSVVKRTYQHVPAGLRPLYVILAMGPREAGSAILSGPSRYLKGWRHYRSNRGMSRWHDLVDWVGGYPFEVAKPEVLFEFFRARGFQLEWMLTCGGGLGCNQFVLQRLR